MHPHSYDARAATREQQARREHMRRLAEDPGRASDLKARQAALDAFRVSDCKTSRSREDILASAAEPTAGAVLHTRVLTPSVEVRIVGHHRVPPPTSMDVLREASRFAESRYNECASRGKAPPPEDELITTNARGGIVGYVVKYATLETDNRDGDDEVCVSEIHAELLNSPEADV